MGYFDGLANSTFKKDAQGRDLFYPNGMLGKGRIIPDAETAAKLRDKVVQFYKLFMFGGLPAIVILVNVPGGIPILVAVGVIATVGTWFFFRSLARDLPVSDERLGYREAQRNAARGHSYFGLVMLAVISFFMTAMGFFVLMIGDQEVFWIGFGCTLLFGACLALFIWMIAV